MDVPHDARTKHAPNEGSELSQVQSPPAAAKRTRARRKTKPSCADCYFGCRLLCALERDEPCTTFRPDHPEGLVPLSQPMLLVGAQEATLTATGSLAA